MKLSLLICLYTSDLFDYFIECYNSIINQNGKGVDEIIIITEGELEYRFNEFFANHVESKLKVFEFREFKGPKGFGFPSALNFGIHVSSGDFVVRMDPDDLCVPNRIQSIRAFIEKHPHIDLFSAHVQEFVDQPKNLKLKRRVPLSNANIIKQLKYRSPFNHPAVVYRRSAIIKIGGYPQVSANEDYCLWADFIRLGYNFSNIDEVHVLMRGGEDLIDRRRGKKYLSGEYMAMKYLYFNDTLNFAQFILSISLRFIVRLLPRVILKKIYKYLRND